MAKKAKTDAQLIALLASGNDAEVEALLATSPARATALCDLGLKLTSRDAMDRVGITCLPPMVRALGRGKQLPAAYDILVSIFGDRDEVRSVFRAVPEPRRTAIMQRQIDLASTEGMGYMHARIFEFMDLTPAALQHLIDRYPAELARVINNSDLAKYAKRNARIAKSMRAARALTKKLEVPKPPPAPKPKGPLTFTFHSIVDVDDADELTGIELEQWRATASAYLPGNVKRAAQFRKKLDGLSGQMRRWSVFRGKKHAYDLWIIAVDNGIVFPAGKPTRAGVYLIQDDWQATDKKKASQQLENDFIASAPSDLWTPR